MHIEKIEYGPEKEGSWSQVAFALIILLTFAAVGITVLIFWKILSSDAQVASTRQFMEEVGKLVAYLLFDLAAIIYLYVKGLMGLITLFFAGGALASILKYLWPPSTAKGENAEIKIANVDEVPTGSVRKFMFNGKASKLLHMPAGFTDLNNQASCAGVCSDKSIVLPGRNCVFVFPDTCCHRRIPGDVLQTHAAIYCY